MPVKITDEDIAKIKSELVPECPEDAHKVEYIMLYERLAPVLNTYLLDEFDIIIEKMDACQKLAQGKKFIDKLRYLDTQTRWRYHGQGSGTFGDYFTPSDAYCIKIGDKLASIPGYDLPHYYADNITMDCFVDWLVDNPDLFHKVMDILNT